MSTEPTKKLADELVLKKNPNPFPFLRGVNFGYLAKQGYYGTKQAETEVDRMADAGIEWVSLMVMLMQETYFSTRIYRDFRWTTSDTDLESEVQANYLDGFLAAYDGQPWWAGFQYWKWEEQQNRPHYHKPEGDTGFTVHGKPAEAVVARWCAKR
jgi:hypothetical protein